MRKWLQHLTHLMSDEQVLAAYDRVAELYPHIPSLSMWRAWEYAAYRGRALQQPVLDVGCGDGQWFRLVWPEIDDVYGIDLEPAVVERARQSGVYRQVWQADAAAMPVEPGMFGTVFANCSLEHMDNIDTVIANAWRALRPGGEFIFSIVTDKIQDWFSPAILVRALGEDALANGLYDEWLHYHHLVNPFPIENWCAALVQGNFEVVEHIPIIPEMTARLFLWIDGLWHTKHRQGELGDQLHPYLQRLPNFPAAFRGILQSALMMEAEPRIGCGAVLVAKKVERAGVSVANPRRQCWCGNAQFGTFSSEYIHCTACGTLISQTALDLEPRVADDAHDFYGQEYWLSHQRQELGLPDIYARARSDLSERCLYWLRALLSYRHPPAKVLELGSSHGGFVALMRWAGYDATGLELSPWVVDFARQAFDVPMLLGAIETQQIEPGTLDVLVLMDVLEHLPDPLGTLQYCVRLLRPDGFMLIQTPSYPDPQTYQQLIRDDNRFLEMLEANEHLYLFSQRAVRELFQQLGLGTVEFLPALFEYDMFFVVSRVSLQDQHTKLGLEASPPQRLVQALLDIDLQHRDLQQHYAQSDVDRAERQANVDQLNKLLVESEADRAARLRVIEEQGRQLHELLGGSKEQSTPQQHVRELEAEQKRLASENEQLLSRWATARSALISLQSSKIYRVARALGRWRWLDSALNLVQSPPPQRAATPPSLTKAATEMRLKRVVVDLTPVLPGGENGGAKLVALGVVQQLGRIEPECEFILLTAERSHAELAFLDAPNVRRICVHHEPISAPKVARIAGLRTRLRRRLVQALPRPAVGALRWAYRRLLTRPQASSFLKELAPDLVFSPFTASQFYDPAIPSVAVVYDLQYLYYPQFFSAEDRDSRSKHFTEVCRSATQLICISEYVRGTVLSNSALEPERVKAVHIRLSHRLPHASDQMAAQILQQHGLSGGQYLLYPANFWPHKNHRLMLTAFAMYRARYPETKLKLVLTGSPGTSMTDLQEIAKGMHLADAVIFPGYVAEPEFAALLQASFAMIYPSLYEGFGMPLLEAMASGKPVLCSNVTSLPEIAGDAALLFDPRKPDEIVDAIARITTDPVLASELVARGYERVKYFDDPAEMARQYWATFKEAVSAAQHYEDGVHGVYADRWIGRQVTITFAANNQDRQLELALVAPDWLPHRRVEVQVKGSDGRVLDARTVSRGETTRISYPLARDGGFVEVLIDPVFQPKSLGLNEDQRGLGCVLQLCRVTSAAGDINLLEPRN